MNETSLAIVVGIEQYGGSIEKLDGPAADAWRFTEWLLKKGFKEENIIVFSSLLEKNQALEWPKDIVRQPATREKIIDFLANKLPARSGDDLIFFWSGHGAFRDGKTRCLFYADASDNQLENLDFANLLAFLHSNRLGPASWKRQTLIVDACSSYAENSRLNTRLPPCGLIAGDPVADRNQFVLAATRPGESAVNLDYLQTGLFTREVLRELESEDLSTWPPDMPGVTNRLSKYFESLRAQGKAEQSPASLWRRDWNSNEDIFCGESRQKPVAIDVRLGPATTQDCGVHLEIIGAAGRCGAFNNSPSLDTIVRHLPYNRDVSMGRSHAERLTNLVVSCCTAPRGLIILLDTAIRQHHRIFDDPAFTDLLGLLDQRLQMALKWKTYLKLRSQLRDSKISDVLCEEAWSALTTSVEPLPKSFGADDPLFLCIPDYLVEKKIEVTDAPLFGFLELCRGSLGQSADSILKWEEDTAGSLGLDLGQIREKALACHALLAQRRRQQATIRAGDPGVRADSIVLIQVSPLLVDVSYQVEAWLLFKGDPPSRISISREAEEGAAETDIPALVERAIQEALNSPDHLGDVRVEVIVPLKLLSEALDEWTFESGFERIPIGRQYPLVVRSQERVSNDRRFAAPRQKWMDKWRELKNHFPQEDRRYWASAAAPCLRDQLRKTLDAKKTLAFLSTDLSEPCTSLEVLQAIIGAGVPLALWLRDYQGHANDRARTQQLLTDKLWSGTYNDWPEKVFELRTQMADHEFCPTYQCRGISLLWDNPELRPPTGSPIRLQAPV